MICSIWGKLVDRSGVFFYFPVCSSSSFVSSLDLTCFGLQGGVRVWPGTGVRSVWHLLDVGMSLCKVEREEQLDYMVTDMPILHFFTQRTGSLFASAFGHG